MRPGIVEYVALRLARRFLFSDAFLQRWGNCIPYYRPNANQVAPRPVCALYADALAAVGMPLVAERTILEVGSGATDAVGLALLKAGLAGDSGRILLHEPHAAMTASTARDDKRIDRIRSTRHLPPRSVDLILSHSVLEHVRDPVALFTELKRVLNPSGCMIHAVDYRDHFFKYPYHFLTFSEPVWRCWLDPGDLPRWRLLDHVRQISSLGLAVVVLNRVSMTEEFSKISGYLAPEFDAPDPEIAVTHAVLVVRGAPARSSGIIGRTQELVSPTEGTEQQVQSQHAEG